MLHVANSLSSPEDLNVNKLFQKKNAYNISQIPEPYSMVQGAWSMKMADVKNKRGSVRVT